jgi:HSP20 family protein
MQGTYLPLRDAIDRLFEGSFISPQMMGGQGGFPPANVHVTDDDVVIEMAVAGAKPEDITISITGDTVTISGEVTREEQHKKGQTYTEEIFVGSFQRSFTLPFPADVNNANASFENGMLKLTLPKSEAAKPRKVQVRHKRSLEGQAKQPEMKTESEIQQERVPAGSGQKS